MKDRTAIRERLEQVHERINMAARSSGRTADQVRLVVVTKGHPQEKVQAVIEAGAEHIGENYVEEALPKMKIYQSRKSIKWHMIGHVQSRKAKLVSQNFDWVQSVDSLKLARRLDRFAAEVERNLPVLLECNVSGEESKFGWPAWNELEWPALAEHLSPLLDLENISVRGLMTMPPFYDDPARAKPFFQRLRELRESLAQAHPAEDWSELSMGMSADYEAAIEEGATMVRIGTAILGQRE